MGQRKYIYKRMAFDEIRTDDFELYILFSVWVGNSDLSGM